MIGGDGHEQTTDSNSGRLSAEPSGYASGGGGSRVVPRQVVCTFGDVWPRRKVALVAADECMQGVK